MRYLILVAVLASVVILTKSATDKICLEETDEEVCDSVHIQCGVTVHIEDSCGNKKDVLCVCPSEMSCSLETLTCE